MICGTAYRNQDQVEPQIPNGNKDGASIDDGTIKHDIVAFENTKKREERGLLDLHTNIEDGITRLKEERNKDYIGDD